MQDLIKGDLIIYEDENDKIEIEAFLYDETIWLPLNKIAELFEKDKSVISRHISNIFEEQELTVDSTVANFATVQIEGNRKVNRNIDYYNLDMTFYKIKVVYVLNKQSNLQKMNLKSLELNKINSIFLILIKLLMNVKICT